jgi:hypothetical protein
MSESDLIEAEIRRLGVKAEDPTQMMLASLSESIANVQISLNREIAGLKELVKHQGQIIEELQKRFKKPIRIEINKEERERIQAIENKLSRVEYTAYNAHLMNRSDYVPVATIPWKSAAEIQILDTNETPPVHPNEKPPVTQIPLLTTLASNSIRATALSLASRIEKSNVVIQQSPVRRVVTKPFG